MRRWLSFFVLFLASLASSQTAVFISGQDVVSGQVGIQTAGQNSQLQILTTSLPAGTVNVAYSATLAAQGGVQPYTWSIIAGALPGGLSLTGATGVISGTPTNNPATYNFTVQVTDSATPPNTATQPLSIFIGCPSLSISTTSPLQPAVVNIAYSVTLQSAGGISPITWTVTAGTLPPGESLSTAGVLSGTPTVAGSYSFTVQAADSCALGAQTVTKNFTEQVNTSGLTITTPSPLPAATAGSPYSVTLAAAGGTTPYSWAQMVDLVSWSLMPDQPANPDRLDNHLTGPSLLKFFWLDSDRFWWLKSTDSFGGHPWDIQSYNPNNIGLWITENGDAGQNCSPYPNCFVDPNAYKRYTSPVYLWPRYFQLGGPDITTAVPGPNNIKRTVNCEVDNQPLINIGNEAGVIHDAGIINWQGSVGNQRTIEYYYYYGLTSSNPPFQSGQLEIYDVPQGYGQVEWRHFTWNGTQYVQDNIKLQNVVAAGGAPVPYFPCGDSNSWWTPYTQSDNHNDGFVLTGMPAGLSLNPSTGVISGTPTTPQNATFEIQVTDFNSNTAQAQFSLTVACPPLLITTPPTTGDVGNLPSGTVGQQYAFQFGATGGFPPLSWSMTGTVPGLSLSTGGLLSGVPTNQGAYSPLVTVTDSCPGGAQSDPDTMNLQINAAGGGLAITTTSPLPQATAGQQYTSQMVATGGIPPYSWSGGSFPAGISMNASGVISGNATQAVTTSGTITVTDSASNTANGTFSLTSVCPTLSITTATLPPGTQGTAYSAQINTNGGYGAISFSATGLPTGLSIGLNSGLISGTPGASGSFSVNVTATDSCSPSQQSVSNTYTLQINTNLAITTTSLPNGIVNKAYSATLSATGGTPPYTWSISSGSLPTGLSLNSSTGVISGTPTVVGTSSFTAKVTDNAANTATASLSITIVSGGTCGPPSYPCSRFDLNTAPNPAVPPQVGPNVCTPGNLTQCGNLTGANTVITDPDFSNRIVRVSDSTWTAQGINTGGGGSAIVNQGNLNSTLFIVQNSGAGSYIVGFNPTTMQVTFHSQIPGIPGSNDTWSFSFTNANILYRMAGSTPQIYKYDLTGYNGGPLPSPTIIFNFDNATCLQADSNWNTSRKVTSKTIFTMSHDDQNFAIGLSNAGGQGTAIFSVVYRIGSGCRFVDTQTGQVGGDFGGSGTITATDRWTIHENVIGAAGDWVVIGFQKCTNGACTKNPYFWQVSTTTVNTPNNFLGGHWDTGYLHWMNNSGGSGQGEQMQERLFTALTTPTGIITNFPNNPPGTLDQHYSWNNNNSVSNDGYANFTTTWTPIFPFPSAWCNEILGVFPSTQGGTTAGTVKRFAHSFITAKSGNFNAKYGIGYESQDGRFFVFSSDWLGTMGSLGGSKSCTPGGSGNTDCRTEVFVVELR